MKTIKIAVILAVFAFALTTTAQKPTLGLNRYGDELHLFGPTNNFYQIKYTTDLKTWSPVWGNWGKKFLLTNSPGVEELGILYVPLLAYRAEVFYVSATNNSVTDPCAEHDGVNVALLGNIPSMNITATHPQSYTPTNYTCLANFSNCPSDSTNVSYNYTPYVSKIFDNGTDYLIVNRGATFWRPQAMTVTMNGANAIDSIHYIELGRRITGYSEWPKFFVLYSDGNIRLIPFPPVGQPSVCFGSSIIVGPAPISDRPVVDIASVDYRTATRNLLITYRSGGTALLDVNTLSRTNAVIKVNMTNFPVNVPFCTFRSMYVSDGNSDCDYVWWKGLDGTTTMNSILSFTGGARYRVVFYQTHLIHSQQFFTGYSGESAIARSILLSHSHRYETVGIFYDIIFFP